MRCEERGSGLSLRASRPGPNGTNMPSKTHQNNESPGAPSQTDWTGLDAMSDEEAEAAALADPDAPPLAPGRRLHRIAKVKRVRWALKLSREAFAERYHIPVEIVDRWERYEAEPD